ncbi:uncharacterized protein LOC144636991 [Oculina patagonica]
MLWFKVFLLPILSCCVQGLTVLPSSLSTLQQATVTKHWPPSLAIWPTPTSSASPSTDVSGPVCLTSSSRTLQKAAVSKASPGWLSPTPVSAALYSVAVSGPISPASSLRTLQSAVVTKYWSPPSTIRPTSISVLVSPSSAAVSENFGV